MSSMEIDGEINKEGNIISLFEINRPKEIKIKINKFKTKENDAKWVVSHMPLNASFSDCLIEYFFLKLLDNQTFVINTNKYKEQVEPIIFKNLLEK